MSGRLDRFRNWALYIAILFHVTGLVGLLWVNTELFASLTPMNMLLMWVLLIVTQSPRNSGFYLFMFTCILVGYTSEWIGINTGILFGQYRYGEKLGTHIGAVPLLIGVNWFIVMYCCGITIYKLQEKIINRLAPDQHQTYRWFRTASVIVDGALLAVFFDWVMEPVAVQLGFWQWLDDGSIPRLNYISWFVVSAVLLTAFRFLRFNKNNVFAFHLLLIELMFFLILRTFL